MKIFFAHATDHSFKYDAYKAIRASAINQKHAFTLPQEQGFQPPMPQDIIIAHDILVAECSFPSTGQGIELGWMHSLKKPVLCLYREDAKPSGSLRNVAHEIGVYKDFDDMIKKIETFIKKYESQN